MSKLITVMLPHVPVEFKSALEAFHPPGMQGITASPCGKAKSIVDLELTFTTDGVAEKFVSDYAKDCKGATLLALIMFYEAYPETMHRVIIYLLNVDKEWQAKWNSIEPKGEISADRSLKMNKLFIHDLIVQGGDLIGVDHRPCFDAGKCLHDPSNGGA